MSIPLDRLYNFLHDVCNHHDVVIYRFFPHGSRNLSDLLPTTMLDGKFLINSHIAMCHDQEPLNYELYSTPTMAKEFIKNAKTPIFKAKDDIALERLVEFYSKLNLRMTTSLYQSHPILLVHSEKNSANLKKYEENLGMAGVYWWCHAVIARDWFRYAEEDPVLNNQDPKVDFLIYNRAWSGTREYRLKFVELLANHQLVDHCRIKFNPIDDGNHYCNHVFTNRDFSIDANNLEQIFELNTADASCSADYVNTDYQETRLEVVLETLFDDERIQLTEKILRPIACGHPFILASTAGSLEYLRSYGFETFNQYIDESYDSIKDPLHRLKAIVAELQRLSTLSVQDKEQLYANLKNIAEKNKKLFFSNSWHDKIVQEFKHNFESALAQTTDFKIDCSDLKNIL